MSQTLEMQALIRHYKQVTGETEVDMRKVAEFAVEKRGWQLPPPVDPMDAFARKLARAAREEIRHDKETGEPYRVNHAVTQQTARGQMTLWVDIDEASRKHIHKSLTMRREQMVGDAVQLYNDQDHWNRSHPDEEPIQLPLDFGPDVEWRRGANAAERNNSNTDAYEEDEAELAESVN